MKLKTKIENAVPIFGREIPEEFCWRSGRISQLSSLHSPLPPANPLRWGFFVSGNVSFEHNADIRRGQVVTYVGCCGSLKSFYWILVQNIVDQIFDEIYHLCLMDFNSRRMGACVPDPKFLFEYFPHITADYLG
jgi:hypothetical protein